MNSSRRKIRKKSASRPASECRSTDRRDGCEQQMGGADDHCAQCHPPDQRLAFRGGCASASTSSGGVSSIRRGFSGGTTSSDRRHPLLGTPLSAHSATVRRPAHRPRGTLSRKALFQAGPIWCADRNPCARRHSRPLGAAARAANASDRRDRSAARQPCRRLQRRNHNASRKARREFRRSAAPKSHRC